LRYSGRAVIRCFVCWEPRYSRWRPREIRTVTTFVAKESSQRDEQWEKDLLRKLRGLREMNDILELPGQKRKLEKIGHPPRISFAILGQANAIPHEVFEASSGSNIHPHVRFVDAGVPPPVSLTRWNLDRRTHFGYRDHSVQG
jgi:hypothetical protein